MFKFHVQSKDLEEAIRKIAIAIPPASQKGDNDGIKLAFYKTVPSVGKSVGLLLAFDGKIQAVSALDIQEVTADQDQIEVHVNGKKMESAAYAFGAIDTILEITIDKVMKISGAGQEVTLHMCQPIVALKTEEEPRWEFEVDKDDFVQSISFGASCFGDDKGQRGLHCVGFRLDTAEKKVCTLSSNGTRCAYSEMPNISAYTIKPKKAKKKGEEQEKPEEKEEPVTLEPVVTAVIEGKQLRSVIRNLVGKKIRVGVDVKKLRISSGSDVIMILTQELAFPMDALLQLIQKIEKKGAWKAPLNKVLQSLAIYEVTMEEPFLRMSRKSDSYISLQGKDELSNATVVCAQTGEVQTVAVDERELKSALNVFSKEKDIIVETPGGKLPVMLRQHEDDPNVIVIMPLAE